MPNNYVTSLGQRFLSPEATKTIKTELVAFNEEYMIEQARLVASTHPKVADELHKTAMIIRRIKYLLEDVSEHQNVS
jgi:hypothetical protein